MGWILGASKKTTKKMIENQRTNATSAVKKGFRGILRQHNIVIVHNTY
jgi:hypothetical protein